MAGDYRPVSLTSIVYKVLETIIREHIISFMKLNHLFSNKQYGFSSGRSTTLQLLAVMEIWTEALDKGYDIDVVYMDYMKAFDTVPHRRLINKLQSYVIHSQLIEWIQDFLSGRVQQVSVNNKCSQWSNVTSGIPQGSVLGPLLFLIFINDLPDSVTSEVFLFADDIKIFREIKGEEDQQDLQQDLTTLEDWSNKWLLRFHPGKCKHMHIGKKSSSSNTYNLHDQQLECIKEEKDIGVCIDDELTFEKHIKGQESQSNVWSP